MSRVADGVNRSRIVEPRGLRRETAAAYVGVSPSKFDEWVNDGRMPKPKRVDGCVVWDRFALDQAFDALPSEGQIVGWTKQAS
jgi:predicted DNA-binding transcriptional regulator AlpA